QTGNPTQHGIDRPGGEEHARHRRHIPGARRGFQGTAGAGQAGAAAGLHRWLGHRGHYRVLGLEGDGEVKAASKIAGGVIAAAVSLVAAYEGRSLVAYLDPVSIPTICEGYTHGVKMGDVATPEQCDELTRQEVVKALAVVDK